MSDGRYIHAPGGYFTREAIERGLEQMRTTCSECGKPKDLPCGGLCRKCSDAMFKQIDEWRAEWDAKWLAMTSNGDGNE